MKKIILSILILVPMALSAQQNGFDKLIRKYENRQGIMAVNLEGNILDGITYFLSQLGGNDEPFDYSAYPTISIDTEEEAVVVEIPDFGEDEGDCEVVEIAVAEADEDGDAVVAVAAMPSEGDEDDAIDYAEYNEYEYVYGETGDYDYDAEDDDDYNYDYSSYYTPYSGLSDYLGMFKTYFEGLTYFKAIVYENPSKKFASDVQKSVVSKKPYKCVVSMRTDGDDVRLYIIDDEAGGQCEMLAIVKEGNRYVVANIMGSRDFRTLIDALKQYL